MLENLTGSGWYFYAVCRGASINYSASPTQHEILTQEPHVVHSRTADRVDSSEWTVGHVP
jgi:hypothetical protein